MSDEPRGVEDVSRAVAGVRAEFSEEPLSRKDLRDDPLDQFGHWMAAALEHQPETANAVTVATSDASGMPSARTVLLRGFDERGFVFFTNYESRKGRDLAGNPQASLLFYWSTLQRQVAVGGPVEKVSPEESDEYFQARPRPCPLGAWASQLSVVIRTRVELEEGVAATACRFHGDVPRPPYCGGFRVVPQTIEFWQGRQSRLHDRFRHTRAGDGWTIERLSP